MSGAGKSTVLDALEDMGWDVVDNLPADLLRDFVHGGGQCRTVPVAVGMDLRSRGFDPQSLPDLHPLDRGRRGGNPLSRLRRVGADPPLRRDPPASPARAGPSGRGRHRPRARPHRAAAHRRRQRARHDRPEAGRASRRAAAPLSAAIPTQPVLTIASFAFARGISRTADLVFDLRFLPNPHWVDELRPADRRGPAGPRLSCRRPRLGRDDGPHRSASHGLDSPLLGRRQKLRDRRVWVHRRAPSIGGRGDRDGGTVAERRIFSECASPRSRLAAE